MHQLAHMFVTRLLLQPNHNTLTDLTKELANMFVIKQLLLNHSIQTDGMPQPAHMFVTRLLLLFHNTPTILLHQLAATIVCNPL